MKRVDNTTLPSIRQVCINITIKNDRLYRGDREFFAVLTLSDPDILVQNNVTSITLVDNDG